MSHRNYRPYGAGRGRGNRNHRGNFNRRPNSAQHCSFEDILNAMNMESELLEGASQTSQGTGNDSARVDTGSYKQKISDSSSRENGYKSYKSNSEANLSRNNRKSGASEEEATMQKYMSRIKINTPEDLAKWIEDRKKNYPTDANIEKKAAKTTQQDLGCQKKLEVESLPKPPNQIGLAYSDSESDADKQDTIVSSVNNNVTIDPLITQEKEASCHSDEPELEPVNKPIPEIKIPKRKICSYFQNGHCARGKKCGMIHIKPTRFPKLHKHGDLYSMLRESESKLNAPALLQAFRLLDLYCQSNQKS